MLIPAYGDGNDETIFLPVGPDVPTVLFGFGWILLLLLVGIFMLVALFAGLILLLLLVLLVLLLIPLLLVLARALEVELLGKMEFVVILLLPVFPGIAAVL